MTDRCKNITLHQTSFAGGNKLNNKKVFQSKTGHLLAIRSRVPQKNEIEQVLGSSKCPCSGGSSVTYGRGPPPLVNRHKLKTLPPHQRRLGVEIIITSYFLCLRTKTLNILKLFSFKFFNRLHELSAMQHFHFTILIITKFKWPNLAFFIGKKRS